MWPIYLAGAAIAALLLSGCDRSKKEPRSNRPTQPEKSSFTLIPLSDIQRDIQRQIDEVSRNFKKSPSYFSATLQFRCWSESNIKGTNQPQYCYSKMDSTFDTCKQAKTKFRHLFLEEFSEKNAHCLEISDFSLADSVPLKGCELFLHGIDCEVNKWQLSELAAEEFNQVARQVKSKLRWDDDGDEEIEQGELYSLTKPELTESYVANQSGDRRWILNLQTTEVREKTNTLLEELEPLSKVNKLFDQYFSEGFRPKLMLTTNKEELHFLLDLLKQKLPKKMHKVIEEKELNAGGSYVSELDLIFFHPKVREFIKAGASPIKPLPKNPTRADLIKREEIKVNFLNGHEIILHEYLHAFIAKNPEPSLGKDLEEYMVHKIAHYIMKKSEGMILSELLHPEVRAIYNQNKNDFAVTSLDSVSYEEVDKKFRSLDEEKLIRLFMEALSDPSARRKVAEMAN